MIAAAVSDHSTFEADPLARLSRTLDLMHTLVSGDRGNADTAAQRFSAMHEHVRGYLREDAGRFRAGTPYSAADPRLKLWVHATLVDTSLITYERFVRPLAREERQRYYADTRILAHLLKIPTEFVPPTLEAFGRYMDAMFVGDALAVTETARRLAQAVCAPQVGLLQGTCAALLRFVTAGLLPQHLRTAYRLPWGSRREDLLETLCLTTRTLRPWAPRWLWRSPHLAGPSVLRRLLWPDKQVQ